MNVLTKLLGAVTICAFAAAFILTSGDTKTTELQPRRPELCTEVEYELDISVGYGLLTEEEAQSIVERCYQTK